MSIISAYESDKSDLLYKRFAFLASSYLDTPYKAAEQAAQVPLENLYRLLEMYKYDAFSDESRSGILAVENTNNFNTLPSSENSWHENIKKALNNAMHESFKGVEKNNAIEELEDNLRFLSKKTKIEPDSLSRTKNFFSQFLQELDKVQDA